MTDFTDVVGSASGLEHPLYRRRVSLYWFWTLTYAGGEYMRGGALNSLAAPAIRRIYLTRDISDAELNYLWRFDGESSRSYDARLDRAIFERLAGGALDAIVAGVLGGAGQPVVPEPLTPMLLDVDARGSTWAEFRLQKATLAALLGHCHVGCDLPDEEMIASGRRPAGLPYLYLIPPTNLIGWELTEWGEWRRAVVREVLSRDVQGPGSLRYRIWTPETIRVTDGAGVTLPWVDADGAPVGDERPNPYGRIPITTTFYASDPLLADERIGRSWMENPARRNQHHYNVGSWIDEIAFKVTFPTLAMPVPEGESSIAPEQKVALGLGQALAYSSAGGPPTWLNPPRESIDVLRDLRNEDVALIRQAAGLAAPEQPSGSNEMPSGEALRVTRANLGALLGSFAANLRAGDERDLRMALECAGWTGDVSAPYPEDYAAVDEVARLDEIARSLGEIGLGEVPAARALLLKAALQAVLPGGDPEAMTEAHDQIELAAKERAELAERQAAEREAALETMDDGAGEVVEDAAGHEAAEVPGVVAAAGAGAGKAQDVALNGAQVTALVEIVKSVVLGEIPRESAAAIIAAAFPLSETQADALLGPAGTPEFAAAPPAPNESTPPRAPEGAPEAEEPEAA